MDERDREGTESETSAGMSVGAKCAYMENLAAKVAAAGYPVAAALARPEPPKPPVQAPAPPPALTFEAWAELAARFDGAPPADLAAALAERGVTLEVWRRFDDAYGRTLVDDIRAGRGDRPAVYDAIYKEERARHAGAPAELTPPALPAVQIAPEHLRGTNGVPDLPASVLARMGRMPVVPPPPAPAAAGKRPAKTVESKVMPSPVGAQTMDLAEALQRPTPDLPFPGSASVAGVVYVPRLGPRQYVALRAELALQPASREETQKRYRVPNEAAFRALEEQWRHPARRAELEAALADFAVVLRGQVLR